MSEHHSGQQADHSAPDVTGHGTQPDGHAAGEHAHKAHHGKGGHGDGHGGGHGGSWIITYCDMITLLIAFFICILTFSSKESGKGDHRKMHDSVVYGPGGVGVAGGPSKVDMNAMVWRQVLASANLKAIGSPTPPMYSDPTMEVTRRALEMLEQASSDSLADNFAITIPVAVLFDRDEALTSSGKQLLGSMAANLENLPFDLLFQVDRSDQLPRASAILQYLTRRGGMLPHRIGIGVRPAAQPGESAITVVLMKRPRLPAH